jgi:hypothetical protein
VGKRTVPAPSCPDGHVDVTVHAYGKRMSERGESRRYRCSPRSGSTTPRHFFEVLTDPATNTTAALDAVKPPPQCPFHEHHDTERFTVERFGPYETQQRKVQRYRCVDKQTVVKAAELVKPRDGGAPYLRPARHASHTFSSALPRSLVLVETECRACEVPTPPNAGTESTTRYHAYPPEVVFTTLKELADGVSYAEASKRAMRAIGREVGETREKRKPNPGAAKPKRSPVKGAARDSKAHWHVAADMLERFASLIIERSNAAVAQEIAWARAEGLPLVYQADEKDVRRGYARSSRSASNNAWAALVVSRVHWENKHAVSSSNRLHAFRCLPTRRTDAWELVLSELERPDFLVADGSSPIRNAAANVWGAKVQFVPCLWHAKLNMLEAVLPAGLEVEPDKLTDHFATLSRSYLTEHGPDGIRPWFEDLERIAVACDLPLDAVWGLDTNYGPLLRECAKVAARTKGPVVPISNSGVENTMRSNIDPLVKRRGPMFTNLARTNLLADLIVARSNGALLDSIGVTADIRDANRQLGGWSPPPRILTERIGVLGLRDPDVIKILAESQTR